MTRYTLHADVLSAHAGYSRGVVWITGARNGPSHEGITSQLRAVQMELQRRVTGSPAEHPHVAVWRDAFRRFGAKPSEHRSAVEALLRRALKPEPLPAINLLVDIGTLVSLRHLLPAGVHPLPVQGGSIDLRPSRPDDVFAPATSAPPECPDAGEIVLASANRVLTRRWTWRQAAGSQTLLETRDVFFNVDGLPPVSGPQVHAAMQDIAELVRAHCGGDSRRVLLDRDNPSFVFRT